MAAAQLESAVTVVTGFNLSALTVAPRNWSLLALIARSSGLDGSVDRDVGGNRSFAASQSSSTNFERYDLILSGNMITTVCSFPNFRSLTARTIAAIALPELPPTNRPSSAIRRLA